MEIKILEEGLDYSPIQDKINETELRRNSEDFARRMRLKWYFRNEPTSSFSEHPSFTSKSSWKPLEGNPSLELFLSQIEKELFEVSKSNLGYSNFSKEEWQCMCLLANVRSIVIKKADKGSCVVVWDRQDYIAEASKQLKDESVYKSVNFKDKILQDLAEKSKGIFKGLKQKGKITDKQPKYFSIEHKKVVNLGEMYLLPKIHKRLYDVPGRPVISNYGTPTEKALEVLDSQLKEIMQNGWSYIKDSNNFIKKTKHLKNIPDNAILVSADVIGLYPSIPHKAGLRALKEVLDRREEKKTSTEDLAKMAEFVLKHNYF